MTDPFWFDPAAVQFKISPHYDLRPVEGGNWDIHRRHPLAANIKYRAILQRYAEGMAWEETDLFRSIYARRFAGGGMVRGEASMEDLAKQYYSRVDGMFDDLRRRGFCLADEDGREYPLPVVLIGRSGEVMLGNQGNHRFAMARVIGLDRMAGRVLCRHKRA